MELVATFEQHAVAIHIQYIMQTNMNDYIYEKSFMHLPILLNMSHLCHHFLDISLWFPVSSWTQRSQVEETGMISMFPVSKMIVER